jgi:hypothetical protein
VRSKIELGLGIIMLALGAFIGVRPLWTHTTITGQRLLDAAFAVLFLVRGWMNVKRARRHRELS